jgi:fatty-acyl-CoA synthase
MRFLGLGDGFAAIAGYRPEDVIYCALPLYHTAGGVVVIGAALASGATVALRRRFSASRFWEDVREEGATAFHYIGEFCRYLVNRPEDPSDRDHRVRVAVGNGLRPDIWERFQQRFGIPEIREFYGATEGNVALLNLDGKPGAVGRIPFRFLMPARLLRYDVDRDEHVRGSDGLCVECRPGEVGELVGRIPDKPDAATGRFEGYTSEEATRKKILRDVFAKGDAWFRTGDLLRCDEAGYFYFVDRIGDTFRWKGENVSTQEVEEILSAYPGVEMVIVYGVELPGADGRAGMAAILGPDAAGFDGKAFHAFARERLARYAMPAFVRLLHEVQVTGTFKLRKVDLQRQGFDPAAGGEDLLLVRDDEAGAYVPLDAERLDAIRRGAHRL